MGWGRPRSPAVPPLGWGPRQDPLGCPESARTASCGHTAAGASFKHNVLFGAIVLDTAILAAFPLRSLGWGRPQSPAVPPPGRRPRQDPLGCPESSRTAWEGRNARGTLGSIPKKRSAPAARGLPQTVRVCTAAVSVGVGSARVVVCGIGTALVGCLGLSGAPLVAPPIRRHP